MKSATSTQADSDSESEGGEVELERILKVGFGSIRNMDTGARPSLFDDNATVGSENTFQYRPEGLDSGHAPASSGLQQPKPSLKRSNSSTRKKIAKKLSFVSQVYDLDGSGELDEIEQAMRDFDKDGDGQLDMGEVHRIVTEQLKANSDVGLYKKVAAGLLCLVAILSLSNFGTSWATAILAKDTAADGATGTIQSKSTGDIVGFQDVAYTLELLELTDEEFVERRRLVDAEMAEDPNHEDHVHRRLGRRLDNACTCSKVAYDHGQISMRALSDLTAKCERGNTVNMKRKWKGKDGTISEDIDQICSPTTNVGKKGKKKHNKKGNKSKVVDDDVVFKTTGKDGKDKSIRFTCNKRNKSCYGSGGAITQQVGEPCLLQRDTSGESECDEDLVCYDPQGGTNGRGLCTSLQMYAKLNQVCRVDFGVNACKSGLACLSNIGAMVINVGQVHTGTCQKVTDYSRVNEVCNVKFGSASCVAGYSCRGANGIDIGTVGIGICAPFASRTSGGNNNNGGGHNNNGNVWYKSFNVRVNGVLQSNGICINDGNNAPAELVYDTPKRCCQEQLHWMSKQVCAPTYTW